MKQWMTVSLTALMVSLAILVGCSEKAEEATKKATDTAAEMKKEVKETTQKAKKSAEEKMESAAAWTKEKMTAYTGEMKEKLGNLSSQFDDLNAKAGMLGTDAKQKFQEQFAAVTEKKEAVAKKMEELDSATGDSWEKAKQELDKLMAELAQLYDNIKKGFSAS